MNTSSEFTEVRDCLSEVESTLLTNYRRVRRDIAAGRRALETFEASVEREHQEVSYKLNELRKKLSLLESKTINEPLPSFTGQPQAR